jgi:ParB family transcriptional regulator, chromosome partitioning protein
VTQENVKMAKIKGLGRGLDALLVGNEQQAREDSLREIAVERVRPGRYQPRTRMDERSLAELAESIKAQGVMQPILVRAVNGNDYEIIAGERRWRAAQIAGLKAIPALIREVPDQAALALALIENIQREDLNPLEEAQGIHRLIDEFHLTHEAAAQAVGRSRSAVTNLLRLMQLAQPVQEMLFARDLEMGHARALLALMPAKQVALAQAIVAKRLSVRETEKLVHREASGVASKNRKAREASSDRDLKRLQEELSELLGAAVRIETRSKGAGRILIDYASLDALDGILARLRKG